MTKNNQPFEYKTGKYSTDLAANASLGFLDEAIADGGPFFIGVAPIGPHTQLTPLDNSIFHLPVPAERHQDLFPNLTAPRGPSFNKLQVSLSRRPNQKSALMPPVPSARTAP